MRPAAIWQFCDLPPHYMREVLDGIHRYVNSVRDELIWERILKHTSHCLLGLCWLWNLVLTWNACVGNKITIMVFTCTDWANIALYTCICTFLWPGVEKITLLLLFLLLLKNFNFGGWKICVYFKHQSLVILFIKLELTGLCVKEHWGQQLGYKV